MTTEMLHRHHTVPKHAGGKDSRIVVLTIEEHAEEHRKLWDVHKRWQDYVAWKALSGQITHKEASRLAFIEGGKYSVRKMIATKYGSVVKPYDVEAFRVVALKNTGKKRSIVAKENISIAMKQAWERRRRNNRDNGPLRSVATKRLLSIARTAWHKKHRRSLVCDQCQKSFISSAPRARFCSDSCKMKRFRRRAKI